ncbi:hypothetical protein K6119_17265 [Paracrocinitomix mangrovi]|uniref:hypothetical protein n=1 Tax=Paracrocinitomix mangrovi TaxID=2862509 RepID=UPI001C8D92DE|nr:hypothetical protein [Paracrocinitomix mangrovi]UKN01477.1 hypothetical protein K6119_17265 [Paracrocinitomix mangrovi]
MKNHTLKRLILLLLPIMLMYSCQSNSSFFKQKYTNLKPIKPVYEDEVCQKQTKRDDNSTLYAEDASDKDDQLKIPVNNVTEAEKGVSEIIGNSKITNLTKQKEPSREEVVKMELTDPSAVESVIPEQFPRKENKTSFKRKSGNGSISFIIGTILGVLAYTSFIFALFMMAGLTLWISSEFLLGLFVASFIFSIPAFVLHRAAYKRTQNQFIYSISKYLMWVELALTVVGGIIVLFIISYAIFG